MEEYVILVDENDQPIGEMEKMEAHRQGLLHRAFSIFIFNSNQELLLQQRAFDKYHCGGLWTNTCCSHPRVNEFNADAAHRRIEEDMGFDCELNYAFNFIYKSVFDSGLVEHEFDHVFVGHSDIRPKINLAEVASFRYVSLDKLSEEILHNPDQFTPWLKLCLAKVKEYLDRTA